MTLKIPTFAVQISNLSDARYFASYGVDYLSFDCLSLSDHYVAVEQINEIAQWVSGPKICLNVIGCSTEFIKNLLTQCTPDALLLDAYIEDKLLDLEGSGIEIIRGLIVGQQHDADDIEQLLSEYTASVLLNFEANQVVFNQETIERIKQANLSNACFIQARMSPAVLQEFIAANIAGIVVKGDIEDEVGKKSFDSVEDIMAFLTVED